MEIINKLVETEDSKKMKELGTLLSSSYQDSGFRMFEGVKVNDNVTLSIQASYAHYCSPRLTLPKEEYFSMELAIIKDGEFVGADAVTDNEELIEALNEYYDIDDTVHANVPVTLLEELYQEITKE